MSNYPELMLYQQSQRLPDGRRGEFMMAYQSEKKDRATAFVLSFFLGWWGIDRFYLGQVALGLFKLLTFGGFGAWWFVDLFLIMGAADRRNADLVVQLAAMYVPALPEGADR